MAMHVPRYHLKALPALIPLLAAFCGPALCADKAGTVPRDLFRYYKQLNDAEKRLGEYKDSDEALAAKLIQLDYINQTRKMFKVQELKLDILASRVANMISREAAVNKYAGHWNLAGEKPYHRYAAAGGTDHVSENAGALSTSGRLDTSGDGVLAMMRGMYDEFMAEKPPDDGHRRTCLDRNHNYVGLGYYASIHEFRYYEEYIDRYLKFNRVDSSVRPEEECRISFKPLSHKHHVYAVIVYYDQPPEPLTPYRINRMGSYDDFTDENGIALWPWELDEYRKGNYFEIPFSFPEDGLYYVHVYLDDAEFEGNKASTKGKIQASGVVIRVGGE